MQISTPTCWTLSPRIQIQIRRQKVKCKPPPTLNSTQHPIIIHACALFDFLTKQHWTETPLGSRLEILWCQTFFPSTQTKHNNSVKSCKSRKCTRHVLWALIETRLRKKGMHTLCQGLGPVHCVRGSELNVRMSARMWCKQGVTRAEKVSFNSECHAGFLSHTFLHQRRAKKNRRMRGRGWGPSWGKKKKNRCNAFSMTDSLTSFCDYCQF